MSNEQAASIVGQFFMSRDNKTLYHIASCINGSTYFLVEAYSGIALEFKSVWSLGKLTYLKLHPSAEAAYTAAHKGGSK